MSIGWQGNGKARARQERGNSKATARQGGGVPVKPPVVKPDTHVGPVKLSVGKQRVCHAKAHRSVVRPLPALRIKSYHPIQ